MFISVKLFSSFDCPGRQCDIPYASQRIWIFGTEQSKTSSRLNLEHLYLLPPSLAQVGQGQVPHAAQGIWMLGPKQPAWGCSSEDADKPEEYKVQCQLNNW